MLETDPKYMLNIEVHSLINDMYLLIQPASKAKRNTAFEYVIRLWNASNPRGTNPPVIPTP